MNWKIRIALLALLVAIFSHAYLTWHYYPLHLGAAEGDSICTLSSKFNCDAVSASRFSSFLGIPLAVWGLSTNFILLVMLLAYGLGLSESPKRLLRWILGLAGVAVIASVVMGFISFYYLTTYCLFCIIAYATSFVIFEALRREQEEPFFSHIGQDLMDLLTAARWNLVYFLLIPLGAFFIHKFFIQQYGAEDLDGVVHSSLVEWQTAGRPFDFSLPPLLTKGAEESQATMTIVEFADFRCGHCRIASSPLDAFVKSKQDVRFKFYAFPLDSACNSAISRGDGISCRLAKAVFCAQRQNHGWDLHHSIFAQQEQIGRKQSIEEVDWELKGLSEKVGIQFPILKTCMDEAETHEIIKTQASLGASSQVEGTPTIFVNGKKLSRGHLLPVLDAVYSDLKKHDAN